MSNKKQKQIPESHYYDGKVNKWKFENFTPPDVPTSELVDFWCQEWKNTEGYSERESALNQLFKKYCPYNIELNDILIKVCTLNDFYSTNIYNVAKVAKEIKNISIDERLKSQERDVSIVVDLISAVKNATKKSNYSFATKYCSHHKPDIYPIYDSYVDLLLRYYRDNWGFGGVCQFKDNDLKNYNTFCNVIDKFQEYYNLEKYSIKDIDKFLWQVGKKHFPKWETK